MRLGRAWGAACVLAAAVPGAAAPPLHRSEVDIHVTAVVDAMTRGDSSLALSKVEGMLRRWPDFRLAHLLRGDLLRIRAGGLGSIGGGRVVGEDLEGFLAEIRSRLEPAPTGAFPEQLVRIPGRTECVLAADLGRGRLYVFRRRGGDFELSGDLYIVSGREGAGKTREGDERTPIGVYSIVGHIPEKRLPEFYGAGALTLDYPNEWDQRRGRTGSGIWIHGTPRETLVRPPRSSRGCLALANEDFLWLAKQVRPGKTVVLIDRALSWNRSEQWQRSRDRLLEAVGRTRSRPETAGLEVVLYPDENGLAMVRGGGRHNGRRRVEFWWLQDGRWSPEAAGRIASRNAPGGSGGVAAMAGAQPVADQTRRQVGVLMRSREDSGVPPNR